MNNDVKEIFYNELELSRRIKELGNKIAKDNEGKDLIMVCVLKGAAMFFSDLIKEVNMPMMIDFISVSSYGKNTESSGVVRFLKDLDIDIEDKDVILVEDIVDTGLTLKYLIENLNTRKPNSLKVCSLLDKPSRRKVDVKIDYIGFEVPDEFIVGYGIDYAENYRNLPYVGTLKEEVYQK